MTEEVQLPLFETPAPTEEPDYGDETSTSARYARWIEKNEHVKRLIAQRAFILKRAGHKTYPIRVIIGVLQYDYDLTTADGRFGINHDYTSRLARDIMDTWPNDLEGFFKVRQLKTE
jgi:hypothetical protein